MISDLKKKLCICDFFSAVPVAVGDERERESRRARMFRVFNDFIERECVCRDREFGIGNWYPGKKNKIVSYTRRCLRRSSLSRPAFSFSFPGATAAAAKCGTIAGSTTPRHSPKPMRIPSLVTASSTSTPLIRLFRDCLIIEYPVHNGGRPLPLHSFVYPLHSRGLNRGVHVAVYTVGRTSVVRGAFLKQCRDSVECVGA